MSAESGRDTTREVRSIHRYLPTVYTDQMMVNFVCGCWQGSRAESFNYDCPAHKPGRETTGVKWCGRAPAYRCIYLDEGEAEPCELHAQEGRVLSPQLAAKRRSLRRRAVVRVVVATSALTCGGYYAGYLLRGLL